MSENMMSVDEIKAAVASIKRANEQNAKNMDLDNFDEVTEEEIKNEEMRTAEFNAKWWNLLYWWALDTGRQPNEAELDALKDCAEIECDAASKIAYVKEVTA